MCDSSTPSTVLWAGQHVSSVSWVYCCSRPLAQLACRLNTLMEPCDASPSPHPAALDMVIKCTHVGDLTEDLANYWRECGSIQHEYRRMGEIQREYS
ncbi:hypothetical protein E2C01_018657 [Portunus trituberculatus]|uniref:Uncharacterized protein n=1 Tax=Portunus trituberculatus TaxID=210409 RepID=A0A5B7DWT1_PORTR|nr:hypothetical protein [Portunus trituberculatus]